MLLISLSCMFFKLSNTGNLGSPRYSSASSFQFPLQLYFIFPSSCTGSCWFFMLVFEVGFSRWFSCWFSCWFFMLVFHVCFPLSQFSDGRSCCVFMLVFLVGFSCWFFLLSSCASALVVWHVDVPVRLLFLFVGLPVGFSCFLDLLF